MSSAPGATTVPAHLLYDIVRKLPEGAEVMLKTGRERQLDVGDFRPQQLQVAMPAAIGLSAAFGRYVLAHLPARFDRR